MPAHALRPPPQSKGVGAHKMLRFCEAHLPEIQGYVYMRKRMGNPVVSRPSLPSISVISISVISLSLLSRRTR